MHDSAGKHPGSSEPHNAVAGAGPSPGKHTQVHAAAAQGIATASSALPHMDRIQQSFGRHDISGIQAHAGGAAAASAGAMGAKAYATGDHVVLGTGTDLHTVAHEAAHVVQQRAGVHLAGGVGAAGDHYEQHADAVADLVVQGKSAEAALDTMAPTGGSAKAAPGVVQHKLEYQTHHAIAPDAAKAAVKADQAGYAHTAEQFELKLGAGLHHNPQAQAGADAMLTRMQQAMTRAGIAEAGQHAAFGAAAAAPSPDLGVVLVRDVREALASGNLREKMGMVYRARFKISEALDTLRQDPAPESQNLIGDEMKTPAMGHAIAAEKAKPRGNVSYAILERRNSVTNQRRDQNRAPAAELSEDQLHDEHIALSAREQAAATPGADGKRAFVPGRQVYVIPPDVRKREQDDLRRVAAGLSGSADMYFHIAKHLNMPEGERRQLRLASLGQMLANRDHSYHEIMHEAKTQGGLGDYGDELPLGYTQLAPLSTDEILATANETDFPGDAQIKAISGPMASSASIRGAAAPSAKSHTYPAVLATLSAYEANPSKAALQAVVASITKWLADEKPGRMSSAATKAKYDARAPHLEGVLKKAQYKLAIGDGLAAKPAGQRETAAQGVAQTGAASHAFMNQVGDLDGDHADWYAPGFRAQTSDMAVNTGAIALPADEPNLGFGEPINANLHNDTKESVGQSRWELEAINGGDGRNVPDIDALGQPAVLRNAKKRGIQNTARTNVNLAKDPADFATLDASDLQALAPNAPLGGMLKRFEGQPVPAELHALNAYTQAGFYEMMNHVLNQRANKAYMATPAGQTWWTNVPDQLKQLISLAISGVRKMKPYVGPVYRGENLVSIRNVLNRPKAAREAHWQAQIPKSKRYDQFVSTSKQAHSSYIVKPGKYTAEHITNSRSGVDISALGGKLDEREVLFAPGTRFKVTAVEDRFDTTPGATAPGDRYGSQAGEAAPLTAAEQGRVKVTFEEE